MGIVTADDAQSCSAAVASIASAPDGERQRADRVGAMLRERGIGDREGGPMGQEHKAFTP